MRRITQRLVVTVTAVFLAGGHALAKEFDSEAEELAYYMGTTFAEQIKAFDMNEKDLVHMIEAGIADELKDEAPEFGQEYRSRLNNWVVAERKRKAIDELVEAKSYLASMAEEDGAITTESGIVYIPLAEGSGEHPHNGSRIRAHYRATLRDGTEFDSSYKRGEPYDTRLTRVIKCWTEGIQLMKPGGKARLGCPPDLAYGEMGNASVPGNAALSFEIELVEVLP